MTKLCIRVVWRRLLSLGVVLILFTIWVPAAPQNTRAEIVHLPTGKPVMIDGSIEPGEWSDATELTMPNDARLYLKRAGEFIYVAIQFPASRSGFTDLYISADGSSIYDLHASAKLGERQLQGGNWSEWKNWWNNEGWVANISRVDSFEKTTFLPTDVREYQIKWSRFQGHEWRFMVDMSMESQAGDYKTVRFPVSASDSNTEKWLRVQIQP